MGAPSQPRPKPSSRRRHQPVIPASAAVSVDVDLILPPGAAPDRVTHRIAYTLKADSQLGLLADPPEVDAPEVAINHQAAIVIRPPVKGDGWLVRRRLLQAQRSQGRTYRD